MRLLPLVLALVLGLAPTALARAAGASPQEAPQRTTLAEPGALDARPPARDDTLQFTVRAGDPLIVALPATVRGAEATYRLISAPALSWLVDRSFMWQTEPGERGELAVRIRRTVRGAEPDTVVLLVTIGA